MRSGFTDLKKGVALSTSQFTYKALFLMYVATSIPIQVQAQSSACDPLWVPTFGELPGVDGTVRDLMVFDDGSGPALYLGGYFEVAGGVMATRAAKWNGEVFAPLGTGVNSYIECMAVYDDGSGPALFAGGSFTIAGGIAANGIAKWDGEKWSAVSGGVTGGQTATPYVYAMIVYDDGSGSKLYVGGGFGAAGGVPCANVAKWDGKNWSSVGAGLPNEGVRAFAIFNDGTGDALYAGGSFNLMKKWTGTTWTTVGGGVNSHVWDLIVFDDGTGNGPALYACGAFTSPGSRVAKWNGMAWSPVGQGFGPEGIQWVYELEVFDDGTGAALYAGGSMLMSGATTVNGIAKWNGSTWNPLGVGVAGTFEALCVFDDGQGGGPALFAGGSFYTNGNPAVSRVAKWDGSAWSAIGSGLNEAVFALAVSSTPNPQTNQPALYVGGRFGGAGNVPMKKIGRWDGQQWSALGTGVSSDVRALLVTVEGDQEIVYAGGAFTTAGEVLANRVARWNGQEWSALGTGVNQPVRTLLEFRGEGRSFIYAGGHFTSANNQTAKRVARWDGMDWFPLADGFNDTVLALAAYADGQGTGSSLYAAGRFTLSGTTITKGIARWTGSSWTSVGSGFTTHDEAVPAEIRALAVHDDGTGEALYAAGEFLYADGNPAIGLARWNGRTWSALSAGTHLKINSMTSFHDGLAVGGTFSQLDGQPFLRIALWDGTEWSALGGGLPSAVNALAASNVTGYAPLLYVGGESVISAAGDSYIAAWMSCPAVVGDVNGDATVNVNDLVEVIASWGPCTTPCDADIAPSPAGDGIVNVLDLLLVIENLD